jgi:hypothetical protein
MAGMGLKLETLNSTINWADNCLKAAYILCLLFCNVKTHVTRFTEFYITFFQTDLEDFNLQSLILFYFSFCFNFHLERRPGSYFGKILNDESANISINDSTALIIQTCTTMV